MTEKYLKLFWYQIFVHWYLKLLDFLSHFVLIAWLSRSSHFRNLRFQTVFLPHKCKVGVFKFIRFEERFGISVDGRPERRNKAAAFSNFFGLVKQLTHHEEHLKVVAIGEEWDRYWGDDLENVRKFSRKVPSLTVPERLTYTCLKTNEVNCSFCDDFEKYFWMTNRPL